MDDPSVQALTSRAGKTVWITDMAMSEVDGYLLGWVADVDVMLGGREHDPWDESWGQVEVDDPWLK